ncbi:MAG: DUF2298 domain-containing protein [Patescibacteria group bacterium]|nr:DUF2298 domain-containing protein [Patescibacteria group bacterium]
MNTQETLSIFYWYLTLLGIGLISLPFTFLLFNKFTSKGYAFTKTVGIILTSYICFLLTSYKLLSFDKLSAFFAIFLWILINVFIFYKAHKNIKKTIQSSIFSIFLIELLFLASFISWTIVRSYQPSIEGLEKFMDFGFVNSTLRSEYLPPKDMWLSGHTINYYWYGHYVTAFLIKISGINSGIGYNLMLATIFGLSLTGIFNIVSTLIKKTGIATKRKIFLGGIISALGVVLAGNFHTPYILWKNNFENYWYPDATRFIGYNPETNDKTIHEFPLYSFVVSDLHAHLINLPFAILYIALLARFLLEKDSYSNIKIFVPLGFVLGIMFMTNSWDFGNYAITTACVIGLVSLFKEGINLKLISKIVMNAVITIITALIVTFPFLTNFESIAQGVDFVKAQTPLWQLLILWGYPLCITLIFLTTLILKQEKTNKVDVFVIALLTAGWILILLPEIIYVKDIYGPDHHRANTMFKLTYQAFVLFYLSSGYVFIRVIALQKSLLVKLTLSFLITILIALVFIYPYHAIKTYYNDFKKQSSLRGDNWLKEEDPESYYLIEWINKNLKDKNAILLEASGDSYTKYNVVSAYTGIPTVLGWFVHQWLWRGSPLIPQQRANDIREIYVTSDTQKAKTLLNKYAVTHVIVSIKERERYINVMEEKFEILGEKIYENGNTSLYKITKSL